MSQTDSLSSLLVVLCKCGVIRDNYDIIQNLTQFFSTIIEELFLCEDCKALNKGMYVCYKFFIINRHNPIRVVIRMGVLTP